MLTSLITSLLIGIIAFLVFLEGHIVVWRILPPKKQGLLLLFIIAFLSYLTIALFSSFFEFTHANSVDGYLLSLSLYLLCIMLYLHFYIGINRSVSVRILGELALSQNKAMTYEEMHSHYSPDFMFHHRLTTLTTHHFLQEDAGTYRCTKKGIFLAHMTCILQRLYRLTHTG